MIPNQLTLSDIQAAFSDVYRLIEPLRTGNLELNGRRVVGAGRSVAKFDYVTRFELDALKVANADAADTTRTVATALSTTNSVRVAAYATRGAAAAHANGAFIASDRGYVLWVSDGTNWWYLCGTESNTLANIRGSLGTSDAGYLFWVTDYDHLLQWSGSAWRWAPGSDHSGYSQLFEAAPAGYGANAWQIYDGSTVARLNADGTTSNVTLDDLSTSAYLKGGTSASAVAAATGTTDTNDNSFEVQSGAGANMADNGHRHGPGTIELRRKQARLYYRR